MQCECSDEFCEESKQRVEICRPYVTKANLNETVVSCRVAQWICAADALCSKALEYYNEYCRSMFHGKKCSRRCLNSISILRRQEKAAKLMTCRCDGQEDYDCRGIQNNMARLCFHKKPTQVPPHAESPVISDGSDITNVTDLSSGVVTTQCAAVSLLMTLLVILAVT